MITFNLLRDFFRSKNALPVAISLFVGLVFYYANPKPNAWYDYTWRIAGALLHGELGLRQSPGRWLNELVPHNGWFYSVFPLGSVVTMIPMALLRPLSGLTTFPAAFLSAFAAAATTWFFFGLSALKNHSQWRRVQLALFPTIGSWMLCNMGYAGAWQIALGFAVLGQVGALYFVLIKPRPILAGAFFALGFGNRTEVLLNAPIFLFLLWKQNSATHRVLDIAESSPSEPENVDKSNLELAIDETEIAPKTEVFASANNENPTSSIANEKRLNPKTQSLARRKSKTKRQTKKIKNANIHNADAEVLNSENVSVENEVLTDSQSENTQFANAENETFVAENSNETRRFWLIVARFSVFPMILGVATLLYNKARFGAFSDFGYARIPGVLEEVNYRNGIFSLSAIPNNVQKMLLDGWRHLETFPYYVPSGWGGSLLLSCPFLLLLFGFRSREKSLTCASWLAILPLTFVMWVHGDPGGWQYSYRYAMVLLPWLFLILTVQKPAHRVLETLLFVVSVLISFYATYLFYWTSFVKP